MESSVSENGNLWAIVLAGGEGVRLRALTRRLYGDDRPKQYAALVGARSLLRQTLDRVGLLIPPERTVVVTLASHARYVEAELRGAPRPHVLAQPYDRGTAAGIFLPAHWIRLR
ncbi:MAG TPA: sugar phosphate nucleotidyltransferase, partial [Methylomirabilota bacterium]|nr:sugar phosphate nucleotidyltransferase [Methylomirabilota bacterium]